MAKVKAKEKGNRRERQAKKELEAKGYKVTKSGGSLGEFDLIAIQRKGNPKTSGDLGTIRLIQVKSGSISPKERKEIEQLSFADRYIIFKELWIYKDYKGKTVEIL